MSGLENTTRHKTPLEQVESALSAVPRPELPTLLAHLEQRARQEADLEAMRGLRDYRAKHFPTGTPTQQRG
jgi:hypothetical protein